MGDPHTSLPAGTVLNDGYYTIIDKIGEGGFGITYSAIQNNLNRKVCIKEYFLDGCCFRSEGSLCVECKPSAIEQFEKYRKAFVHEAEMVAAINHLNVVDVIAIFSENNTDYMVMQFIEGQTLDSLVKEKGPIQFAEAMNYMSQIADAVGYIHDRNILHRDIKPSNIMITHDFRAILIDFGSAREFVDNKTQAHTSILTRGYAPPEQYSTMSRKGRYSDIYSLGATFYYVLTATEPVDAAARMSEQLIEPHSINSAIPAHVSRAIMKAMSLNTSERYQNIQVFFKDLSYGNSGKVENTPKSLSESHHPQDVKPRKKNILWWVLSLVGVLIVIALFFVTGTFHDSGEKADNRDKERARKQSDKVLEKDNTRVKGKNNKSDTVFNVNGVGFKMVFVDGGTFTMGGTAEQGSDCDDDELPTHRVTLSDYYIGETEVTQQLYEAVMGTNPSTYKGSDLPVGNISWEEAVAFCNKLSGLTGCTFRLPTEAEWEYAARGGHKAVETKYSGNNTLDEVAWYRDNSSGKTYPIKTKKPNELGIYDMSGCVWEWCQDWYGEYSSATCTNPKGPSAGSCRVIRGGSWFGYASHCRVSNRHTLGTATRSSHLGFRLVLVQ